MPYHPAITQVPGEYGSFIAADFYEPAPGTPGRAI